MIEKYDLKGTEKDGIFFSEGTRENVPVIAKLAVSISRQNSNLSELKSQLSEKAKRVNANAIINFKYGQKKHKWWQQILTFRWDTESWHGSDDAVWLA